MMRLADASNPSIIPTFLYRRGDPYFYAFDLLWLNGNDLRSLPLIERKKKLKKLRPRKASRLLYVDHLERQGTGLFRAACKHDLEGIVAKWKLGAYIFDQKRSTWIKVRNPRYTQWAEREELFEKRFEMVGK
ncbi:MAG TPA: hypothetical protein VE422_47095 [Terriglobia bacterium]|nr:hypothetical protein [Terriglobia bacterium]